MPSYLAAGLLSAVVAVQDVSAAVAASVPIAPPSAQGMATAPVPVSENWSATKAAVPSSFAIRRAVREAMAEEDELAEAASKAAAIPIRYSVGKETGRAKYERFERGFAAAKIPGCFQSNGLKHQSTFIFSGLLAAPFIPIAALRGKCN